VAVPATESGIRLGGKRYLIQEVGKKSSVVKEWVSKKPGTVTGEGCDSNDEWLCVAEVARTRLREEGSKYRSFFQTLSTVFAEEGVRGLYRGLATQLVRQIPNTAIVMSTYEAVVYILSRHIAPTDNEFYDKTDLDTESS